MAIGDVPADARVTYEGSFTPVVEGGVASQVLQDVNDGLYIGAEDLDDEDPIQHILNTTTPMPTFAPPTEQQVVKSPLIEQQVAEAQSTEAQYIEPTEETIFDVPIKKSNATDVDTVTDSRSAIEGGSSGGSAERIFGL